MTLSPGLAAQRFGYGARGGVLPAWPPADRLGQPDEILERFPGPGMALVYEIAQRGRYRVGEVGRKDDPELRRAARKEVQRQAQAQQIQNARLEIARAVSNPDSYRERLVRFWADHFTVVARRRFDRPLVTAFVDDVVRPHVDKPFAQMLRAAMLHPTMLLYLEQDSSAGPGSAFGKRRSRGLNENLGRELLELHTLGLEGGYTQKDVRQTALLLTGLALDPEKGTVFVPRRAEPGAETILGKAYGSQGDTIEAIYQLLDDLAVHPATARHLAWKLAVHFVSDQPPPELVNDLAAIWTRTGGDLRAVATALVDHPAAHGPELQKVRQPFDFLVASLRALDVDGDKLMTLDGPVLRRLVLTPLATMGQPWQAPNGPDGWEEDLSRWVTPQGLASRIDWAMHMPAEIAGSNLPDARDFVDMALPGLADDTLRSLVARSETNAEGVGLVLASPQFNRR